ncbi:MAG: molybdopterin molybdotransferase MoeA [Helicobacteraceae bacterium]|jgi:molybdopterin molybdotransferase|nr:molybdopterin molybdotransferase MoeA [Helicobacteraceae bacterium]
MKSGQNSTLLSVGEALDILLSRIEPIDRDESAALFDCAGRTLFEDILAKRDLPSFDNSAMDGYAVKIADAGKTVRTIGRVYAGADLQGAIKSGECIKIMTGAPIPEGAEAIAMIEHVQSAGENLVKLPEQIALYQHIRKAGEEIKTGDTLLRRGERLNAVKCAALASQGVTIAKVYQRLKVAVISSGDEVVEPWLSPSRFQIFNTNAVTMTLSLKEAGFDAHYEGLCKDDPRLLAQKIEKALSENDALIVTGGVSVGDADYARKAFESLNAEIFFHGLNFKPGKPTMTGKVFGKHFFALPGNPLSAFANLRIFAFPALRKLQGDRAFYGDFCVAINDVAFEIKGDRDTAFLGALKNGRWQISRGGKYGSSMLLPIVESDSFAIFTKEAREVKAGEIIKIVPFDRFPKVSQGDPINRGR